MTLKGIARMVGNAITRTHEVLSSAARHRREAEEQRLRVLRDRREADLRWMMSSPSGRRIVAQLMAEARLQDTVTAEQIPMRNHMVRFAGELIAVDHELWLLMIQEAHLEAINASRAS